MAEKEGRRYGGAQRGKETQILYHTRQHRTASVPRYAAQFDGSPSLPLPHLSSRRSSPHSHWLYPKNLPKKLPLQALEFPLKVSLRFDAHDLVQGTRRGFILFLHCEFHVQ